MPKVFVSILSYNGNKDTQACLGSLEEINTAGFELSVVVIDNASKEKFTDDRKYQSYLKNN